MVSQFNRFSAVMVLACASLLVACGDDTATDADAGVTGPCATDPFSADCRCNLPRDCTPNKPEDKLKWICTASKRCVRTCLKNADCREGELCEDAICRPPACGSDTDCTNGDICSGGSCKPAPAASDVKSCLVLPANAVINEGGTETFQVLARDASGEAIPYMGEVTWTAEGGTIDAKGTLTGGNASGALKVSAKVGALSCTDSTGRVYAKAAAADLRIVVADLMTKLPIKDAAFVGETLVKSDENGVITVAGGASNKKTVTIVHNNYSYVTLVDVAANDLVVYLKPKAKAGKFTGTMDQRAFDDLSDLKGTVHLAIYGGSVPGNLIDLQLSTLLGELVDTELDVGQKVTVPLPAGTIIGLGEQMFRTKYEVLAPVGIRTVWGLGGNADFAAITNALQDVIGGGTENLQVGPILTKLLPLLGKLQSGVVTGLEAKWDDTKKEPVEQVIGDKMKLDTLLRIKAEVTLPDLPKYDGDKMLDGAIVLGGALHSPQGLVPLGITAGLDGDPTGKDESNKPDGKVDGTELPTGESIPAGTVAMRIASLHGGLETSKHTVVALAASLSSLLSSGTDGLMLSGLIAFPEKLTTKEVNKISMGAGFLKFPTTTLTGRNFKMTGSVEGAKMHRLDIGNEETGEWAVYFPSNVSQFSIPAWPAGAEYKDRFAPVAELDCATDASVCGISTCDATTKKCKAVTPGIVVQSVDLSAGDYESVLSFDGKDMDDLTSEISAFSVRGVKRTE